MGCGSSAVALTQAQARAHHAAHAPLQAATGASTREAAAGAAASDVDAEEARDGAHAEAVAQAAQAASTATAAGSTSTATATGTPMPTPTPAVSSSTSRSLGGIQWKKGELIGAGSYGKVYVGLNEASGVLMAVKEVRASSTSEVEALQREVGLMRSLRHENIVQYLGSEADSATNSVYIFTEWVPGGSISNLLQKFGRLTESVVRNYTRQILQGLVYLHRKGVVHRDIKGANILVSANGVQDSNVKLADFGASKLLDGAQGRAGHGSGSEGTGKVAGEVEGEVTDNQSLRGTPYFMAPEVVMQRGHGRKADIWSVACTVLQMVSGKPPWKSMRFGSVSALMFHIADTPDAPPLPEDISSALRSFLMIGFQRNPSERPTAKQLLQHPFLDAATGDAGVGQARKSSARLSTVPPPPSSSSSSSSNARLEPQAERRFFRSSSTVAPEPAGASARALRPSRSKDKDREKNKDHTASWKLLAGTDEPAPPLSETAGAHLATRANIRNNQEDDGEVVDELAVSSYLQRRTLISQEKRKRWCAEEDDLGGEGGGGSNSEGIEQRPGHAEEEQGEEERRGARDFDPLSEWSMRENTVIKTVQLAKMNSQQKKHEQEVTKKSQQSEERWRMELQAELEYQRQSGLRS